MASNSNESPKALMDKHLLQLIKLIKEDDKIIKNVWSIPPNIFEDHKDIKNTIEITNIMVWLSTNHPELLEDNSKELCGISIKRLDFRKSWEFHDELPYNALITLLNSTVCKDLQAYCGYLNLEILNLFPKSMSVIRVSLDKNSDIISITEELKRWQEKRRVEKCLGAELVDKIIIHLKCGELELKDLSPLPEATVTAYISGVTDNDVEWVVHAVITLLPNLRDLYLPRSKLTATGVESIAKGLHKAKKKLPEFGVSSPHIVKDESVDSSDDDYDSEDSSKENNNNGTFATKISRKYNIRHVLINGQMYFAEFADYIPDDFPEEFMNKLQLTVIDSSGSDSDIDWTLDTDLLK